MDTITYALLKKKIDSLGISDTKILEVVETFLLAHPEYIGATDEQVAQIVTNAAAIQELQNDAVAIVTLDEYNAFTEEQKKEKVYLIWDKDTDNIKADLDVITLDEYNALSEVEKKKRDYLIYSEEDISIDEVLDENSIKPVQNKVITKEINEIKKSVSDGKSKVANAITGKGVATEVTDTFNTMAENIGKISSGGSNNLAGLYQERSSYTVNAIRLGKETTENKPDSNEHYWVPAIDDTKMQEIATALAMKINIITSGQEWILYRGDDAHKNTGIKFVFKEIGTDEYKLTIQTVVNGKADLEQSVNLYKDIDFSNNTTAARAYLCYLRLANDNVIFGVGNDSHEILLTIVSTGHNISTNEKVTLYTFIVENRSVYMYTETSSSKYSVNVPSLFQEDSSTITVLTPIPIISENILSDSVFRPICFSHRIQSLIYEHRAFTMNDTSYFVTNGGQCAVVVSEK